MEVNLFAEDKPEIAPRDCLDIRNSGATISGVYQVNLNGTGLPDIIDVYCDMDADGGGWLVSYRN